MALLLGLNVNTIAMDASLTILSLAQKINDSKDLNEESPSCIEDGIIFISP